MPSLTPTIKRTLPPYDAAVFRDEACAATVARVERFLARFWTEDCMALSEEVRNHPFVEAHEYDPVVPTVTAYLAEIDLVNGIAAHAKGDMSDDEMKVILARYVDSHTYVYRGGIRTLKIGDGDPWPKRIPLVYLTAENGMEFTCTDIQAELIAMMLRAEGEQVKVRRL